MPGSPRRLCERRIVPGEITGEAAVGPYVALMRGSDN